MGRIERIRHALGAGEERGVITDYYCQTGMPGRRWTVWGTAVFAHEYDVTDGHSTAERTYSTGEVEEMLREQGLL